MFTVLHREEKRGEGDRGGQKDKGGNQKERERQIHPVLSSLNVLHSPEQTKRFTELGREEKGEGGDRSDVVEKKESPKRERSVKPVISLPSKNAY